MAKKVVKKKKVKLKINNFILVLVIILGLSFGVYYIYNSKTKNIIIKNTTYLNDDYIINLARIKNYPKFLTLNTKKIKNRLISSSYIKDVKIKKKFGNKLVITVDENKPLFYDESKEKYIFSIKENAKKDKISDNFRVPRLLNHVPDDKYEKFITGMSKIKENVICKISDIEYQPNEYDKDRFLLYMDDGNSVYLTLTKFKMINHYNEVLSQLENHKGILYLDNGNHFKIKE